MKNFSKARNFPGYKIIHCTAPKDIDSIPFVPLVSGANEGQTVSLFVRDRHICLGSFRFVRTISVAYCQKDES